MAGLPGEPLLVAPHDASVHWCGTLPPIAGSSRMPASWRRDLFPRRWRGTPSGRKPPRRFSLPASSICNRQRRTGMGLARSLGGRHRRRGDADRLCQGPQPQCLATSGPARQQDHPQHPLHFPDPYAHWGDVGRSLAAWHGRSVLGAGLAAQPQAHRPLILQHEPQLSRPVAYLDRQPIGSFSPLLLAALGLRESAGRRVWLFLDEFPQLPAIKQFPIVLGIGEIESASAVVIGAQDMAQIKSVYGENQAKAWFGTTGTKIITRIHAGDTAEEISRTIGDQEIERTIRTHSHSTRHSGVSESLHREMRRVVTASVSASRLGPHRKHGVRVLVMGLGADVYELDLPFITLPGGGSRPCRRCGREIIASRQRAPASVPPKRRRSAGAATAPPTRTDLVASISARGSARAAVSYYAHLSADSYYTRDGEPPGRWGGAAAERLGLDGPVTQSAFNEALQGHDPTTGGALVKSSPRRVSIKPAGT